MTSRPPFAGLRRVLAAPWLVLGLGAVHLALAVAVAAPVRAAFRAAMGPFFHEGANHLIAPLIELMGHQRAAPAALTAALVVTTVVALVFGPLLAGAAIQRLAGPCKPAEQARVAVAHYPAALVIGLYGVILRALLLLIAAALGQIHGAVRLVLVIAVLTYAAAVVDLTRARVVLAGARGFHPRTFVRAAMTVAHEPRLWLRSSAATLLQAAIAGAIVLITLHGLGAGWTPWAVRGLALLSTFAALWRLAVAVDHAAVRSGE